MIIFHISNETWSLGQQLRTKNFTHFPTLSLQSNVPQETDDKYAYLISDLNLEQENRFQDFKKHQVLFWAFTTPFAVDVNLLPGRLQMEHCDKCCGTQIKKKFHQVGLEEFYKTFLDKNKDPVFYKHSLSMVSLFGNTYAA